MSKNSCLGYYKIGGKVFWDKATASMEGTKMGLDYDDLTRNLDDFKF